MNNSKLVLSGKIEENVFKKIIFKLDPLEWRGFG
jgi:hypothetical protein